MMGACEKSAAKRPHRLSDGVWRYDTEPSALRRKRDWDYRRPGTYAITLVLADRSRDWLGCLVAAEQARPHGQEACEQARTHGQAHGRIALTPLGERVARLWRELGALWPGVEPREAQVMPEHFHGILRITTPQKHPLGQIIGSFKAKCTAEARQLVRASLLARGEAREAGLLARGEAREASLLARGEAREASLLAREDALELARMLGWAEGEGARGPGRSLWAPGLHDRILWNLARYRNAREYLLSNPDRLAMKRAHPALFKVVRDLVVPLVRASLLARGEARDASLLARGEARDASLLARGEGEDARLLARGEGEEAAEQARPHGLARPHELGHFSALGNHYLLQRPLWQVQVSRRDFAYKRAGGARPEIVRDAQGEPQVAFASPAFERARERAREAAREGDVLISPCVSDGERQIAREALAAQWPLVAMQNKGFAPLQKPAGAYFEACAAGRLLLLAPAAWPYQPGHKPMTRFDATAMNRLCQWIVGEGAPEINYHGMKPANIDALACAAARVCPCERACSLERHKESLR